MDEPTTPDAPSTLEAIALRIGRYRWIEMRLFEALGGWVTDVPELDAKALLATHSRHHGWHAELWHDLLPELPVLPTTDGGHPGAGSWIDDWAPPPSDEQLAAFAAALTEPQAPGLTVEMLVQSLVVEPGMLDRAAAHQVRLEKLLLAAGGIAGRPPDGA